MNSDQINGERAARYRQQFVTLAMFAGKVTALFATAAFAAYGLALMFWWHDNPYLALSVATCAYVAFHWHYPVTMRLLARRFAESKGFGEPLGTIRDLHRRLGARNAVKALDRLMRKTHACNGTP